MMQVGAIMTMAALMGVYQGINPSMGWLYATSRGLERQSKASLVDGGIRFALGHYLGMNVVLLPMAWILALSQAHPMVLMPWIGGMLILYGMAKLVYPGHPRLLARIPPKNVTRYSFVMALTHCGSPLMMIAPLLSLAMISHAPTFPIKNVPATLADYTWLALGVSAAMAMPQLVISLSIALVVYLRLGLKALTRYWINFDAGWSVLFILMGLMAVRM